MIQKDEDPEAAALTHRKGYHLERPHDRHGNARQEIADYIGENFCQVRYHHDEVGISSQQEIEPELSPLPKVAVDIMFIEDIIRQGMEIVKFSSWERGVFRRGKEIKGLRGGLHRYAAQASSQVDAAMAQKKPFPDGNNLEAHPPGKENP